MCVKSLKNGLLLLALAFSLPWALSSLSPDEEFRTKLEAASKNDVIEIAVVLNKTLREVKTELTTIEEISAEREKLYAERQTALSEGEALIDEKEKRLDEREAALNQQRTLLTESWEIQKKLNKQQFWKGLGWGSVAGSIVGGVAGYGSAQLLP